MLIRRPITNWTWPSGVEIRSLEFKIRPNNNPWNDKTRSLHSFSFVSGGTGWAGLESNGQRGGGQTGKVASFVIVGATQAGGGAWSGNADGGLKVSMPLDWKSGRQYWCRVLVTSRNPDGTEWWSFYVRDQTTTIDTFVGRLLVPAVWGYLGTTTSSYVEYYGVGYAACTDFTHADITHYTPTINVGVTVPLSHVNTTSLEAGYCTNVTSVDSAEGVKHDLATTGPQPLAEPPPASPGSFPGPPVAPGGPVPGVARQGISAYVVDKGGKWITPIPEVTVHEVGEELNIGWSASVGMNPTIEAAQQILTNKTEIQIYDQEQLLAWVVPRRVRGDHTHIIFECDDILSYLAWRYVIYASLEYPSMEQMDIGKALVNFAQTGANMPLNIGIGAYAASGIIRSRLYLRDEHPNVLKELQEFTTAYNGFDYAIECSADGQRLWTPYYPNRGTQRDDIRLVWGSNVKGYNFSEDGMQHGTFGLVTGGSEGDIKFESYYEDAAKSLEYGVYQFVVADGSQKDINWLQDRARNEVDNRKDPIVFPELICDNSPVRLVGNVKAGDRVWVDVVQGRVNMVGYFRAVKVRRLENGNAGITCIPIVNPLVHQSSYSPPKAEEEIADVVEELADRVYDLEQQISSPETFQDPPFSEYPGIPDDFVPPGDYNNNEFTEHEHIPRWPLVGEPWVSAESDGNLALGQGDEDYTALIGTTDIVSGMRLFLTSGVRTLGTSGRGTIEAIGNDDGTADIRFYNDLDVNNAYGGASNVRSKMSLITLDGALNFYPHPTPVFGDKHEPVSGQARIYYNMTTNKLQVSENGSTYVNLVGPGTNIGYGAAGTFLLTDPSNATAHRWTTNTEMVITTTGKVGIGTSIPAVLFHVVYPFDKSDTSERFVTEWSSNDASTRWGLKLSATGSATQSLRRFDFQTHENGVANIGNLNLQPYGGRVGVGLLSNVLQTLTVQTNIGIRSTAATQAAAAQLGAEDVTTYQRLYVTSPRGATTSGWAIVDLRGFDSNIAKVILYNDRDTTGGYGVPGNPKSPFFVELIGTFEWQAIAAAPAVAPSGTSRVYQGADGKLKVSENTGAYQDLVENIGVGSAGTFLVTDPANATLRRWTSTTEFIIDTSGRVGIGTSAPASKLDLFGVPNGTSYQLSVSDTTAQATGVGAGITLWGKATNAGGYGRMAGIKGFKENSTTGDYTAALIFLTPTSLTNDVLTEKMRLSSAGNLGIGTGSAEPAGRLHVKGGATIIGTNLNSSNSASADGFLTCGDTNKDYTPASQLNWNNGVATTLLIQALTYSVIGFHDAGSRVDFIRVGAGQITLGYDGGFGNASVRMFDLVTLEKDASDTYDALWGVETLPTLANGNQGDRTFLTSPVRTTAYGRGTIDIFGESNGDARVRVFNDRNTDATYGGSGGTPSPCSFELQGYWAFKIINATPPVSHASGFVEGSSANIYYDGTTGKLKVSENGGAYIDLTGPSIGVGATNGVMLITDSGAGGGRRWTTSAEVYYQSGQLKIVNNLTTVGGSGVQLSYAGSAPGSGPGIRWSDGTYGNTLGLYVNAGLVFQGNTSNPAFIVAIVTNTSTMGAVAVRLGGGSSTDVSYFNAGTVIFGSTSTATSAKIHVNASGQAFVVGTTTANYISIGTTDPSTGAWFRNDGLNLVISSKVGDIYYGFNGASAQRHFWCVNGSGSASMTLDAAGLLGIGITPVSKLHVNGDIRLTPVGSGIRFPVRSGEQYPGLIFAEDISASQVRMALVGPTPAAWGSPVIDLVAESARAYIKMYNDRSTDGFYGNAGVGNGPLDVDIIGDLSITGSTTFIGGVTSLVIVDSSPSITIRTTSNTGGAVYLGNSNHGMIRSGNDIYVYTSSGSIYLSPSGTSTSYFQLVTTGVGIGGSPISTMKLDVFGNARFCATNKIQIGDFDPASGAWLRSDGNFVISNYGDMYIGYQGTSSKTIRIGYGGDEFRMVGDCPADSMVITTTGTGIGMSPTYKLDVAGIIRSQSFLYIDHTGITETGIAQLGVSSSGGEGTPRIYIAAPYQTTGDAQTIIDIERQSGDASRGVVKMYNNRTTAGGYGSGAKSACYLFVSGGDLSTTTYASSVIRISTDTVRTGIGFNCNGTGAQMRYQTDTARFSFKNSDDSGFIDIQGGAYSNGSSRSIKRDIRLAAEPTPTFMNKIIDLKPVWFKPKDADNPRDRLGLIAEEVYKILPQAVTLDVNGNPDGIDTFAVTTALLLAVQELKQEIAGLKA